MAKRMGRRRDSAFSLLTDQEFKQDFYDRRRAFDSILRLRIEAEAKARGVRNVQKRKR